MVKLQYFEIETNKELQSFGVQTVQLYLDHFT